MLLHSAYSLYLFALMCILFTQLRLGNMPNTQDTDGKMVKTSVKLSVCTCSFLKSALGLGAWGCLQRKGSRNQIPALPFSSSAVTLLATEVGHAVGYINGLKESISKRL